MSKESAKSSFQWALMSAVVSRVSLRAVVAEVQQKLSCTNAAAGATGQCLWGAACLHC